jgi:hypothetical protein
MKHWPLILFSLFLGFSCSQSSNRENSMLSKDQMSSIIWDLTRVDEFAATRTSIDSSRYLGPDRIKKYQQVFRMHKTTKAAFDKSYRYYEQRPSEMRAILDSITSRYSRKINNHGNQVPKISAQPL